jgi:hypothetical protein
VASRSRGANREYQRLRRAGLRGRDLLAAWREYRDREVVEEWVWGEGGGRWVGRQVGADWLASAGEWRLWITLTWPTTVGEDRRRWQAVSFVRRWLRGAKWVLAWERHRDGRLHAHVLAEDPGVRRLSMMDAWEVESGGYARVEVLRSPMQAAGYLLKYVTKGGDQLELSLEV